MRYFFLFLSLLLTSLPAHAARYALVIGNSNYPGQHYLGNNPRNDARAIGAALQDIGFRVTLAEDLKLAAFKKTINTFARQLNKNDEVVFYYSGHGVQASGKNYLLPLNSMSIVAEGQLESEGVAVSTFLLPALSRAGTVVVILDACRNNPFKGFFKGNAQDGLAKESTPNGFLIAFAANENELAATGVGLNNSPYVEALKNELRKPEQNVHQVFTNVRNAVRAYSGKKQNPVYNVALNDPDYRLNTEDSPDIYTDPTTHMTFAKIPGGCFQMGSPDSEKDRDSDEKQHRVCVHKNGDFWMAKHEVTNAQFVQFLNSVKRRGTEKQPWFETQEEDSYSKISGSTGNFRVVGGYENHPVVEVSWYGANAFIDWLSQQSGKNYRLPTEAEWEYAARAGTTTPFYTGNCISTDQANYDGNYPYQNCPKGEYRQGTVAVGSLKSPNTFGLHDMHGNVWEWTCSAYDSDKNGADGCVSNNHANNSRVLRGGSWFNDAVNLRAAGRGGDSPDYRDFSYGFRVMLP